MLFYSTVFVACLCAAIIIPWLVRTLSGAGTTVRSTIRKSSKKGPTGHLGSNPLLARDKETWEMVSRNSPGLLPAAQVSRAEAENELDANGSYFGPCNEYSAPLQAKVRLNSAGWLSREDGQSTGGKTYKVKRRLKVREKNPKYVNRPTSWE